MIRLLMDIWILSDYPESLADELIVGVLNNKAKIPLFSVEERVKMLEEMTKNMTGVKVVPFEGLLVDFAKEMSAGIVVRGLRAVTDFEYELQMAQTNNKLSPELEKRYFLQQVLNILILVQR